jgi:hypothetical protein
MEMAYWAAAAVGFGGRTGNVVAPLTRFVDRLAGIAQKNKNYLDTFTESTGKYAAAAIYNVYKGNHLLFNQ